MNTWVKVARYNLLRRANYLVLPWILLLSFAVGAVTVGRRPPHVASGYLISFFLYFAVQAMQTIGQSLPFGLTLGASRRLFYFGTALLGMALALVSGLALTALQAIERATGGWGCPFTSSGAVPLERPLVRHLADLGRSPVRAVRISGSVRILWSRWGLLGTLTFIALQALWWSPRRRRRFEHWHVRSAAGGPYAASPPWT